MKYKGQQIKTGERGGKYITVKYYINPKKLEKKAKKRK
jgi:hypothetical protein